MKTWPFTRLNIASTRSNFSSILAPTFFKQTPFRLTLVFIIVYSVVALLIFSYVYVASSQETRAVSDAAVQGRLDSLQEVYKNAGQDGVINMLNEDDITEWFFLKGLINPAGAILAQNRRASVELKPEIMRSIQQISLSSQMGAPPKLMLIDKRLKDSDGQWHHYRYRGKIVLLQKDLALFVAMDTSWADSGFDRGLKALWGGAALVVILGLLAGMLINQEVSRSVQRLSAALDKVQKGDQSARVLVNHSGDEFDSLGQKINQTLDEMEKSMGNLKYAGDAIAHDLRTPLSRLRSKLELSLIEVERDPNIAPLILSAALDETDQLLRTFQTVFSISRLEAQGSAPDQGVFSAHDLASDMAELFEPVAQDKGLEFDTEFTQDLKIMGNRDFLAQALANLLDNAIKYTPSGGITFRLRQTSNAEIEFSVTDTGLGVPEKDRERIMGRFVRLENSRSLPGVGLGLAMVCAVASAHKGRLEIDSGPGAYKNQGPGLRTALVLPSIRV